MASNLASELSGTQVVELVTRLGRGGLTVEKARELMGDDKKMEEFVKNGLKKDPYLEIPAAGAYQRYAAKVEGRDIVEVPDLSAVEFFAEIKRKFGANNIYGGFQEDDADFIVCSPGKSYEVTTWSPQRRVKSEEVREHFYPLGFSGNNAAFLAWIMREDPGGLWASIPSLDGEIIGQPHQRLILRFQRDEGCRRKLDTRSFTHGWKDGHSFVAFREIPKD